VPLAKPFLKKPKRDLTLRTDFKKPAEFLKSMKEGEKYEHHDEVSSMRAEKVKGGYSVTTFINSQTVSKILATDESPLTTSKLEGIDPIKASEEEK
jgi:hypothetical protein